VIRFSAASRCAGAWRDRGMRIQGVARIDECSGKSLGAEIGSCGRAVCAIPHSQIGRRDAGVTTGGGKGLICISICAFLACRAAESRGLATILNRICPKFRSRSVENKRVNHEMIHPGILRIFSLVHFGLRGPRNGFLLRVSPWNHCAAKRGNDRQKRGNFTAVGLRGLARSCVVV